MSTDQITFTLRKDCWKERSQVPVTVRFRDRALADEVTPTNVRYRLDCLTTGAPILDWTSVTPGETVAITVTPTQNAIVNACNRHERKQLMVAADYGLSTQFVEAIDWEITNLQGLS
jgi:hypothetical protein